MDPGELRRLVAHARATAPAIVPHRPGLEQLYIRWVEQLRADGVKLAHPDDGWVDLTAHTLTAVYPDFDDDPAAGDQIALGWPWRTTRLLTVLEVTQRWPLIPGATRTLYRLDKASETTIPGLERQ